MDDERLAANPCLTKRGSCPKAPRKRAWHKIEEPDFERLLGVLDARDQAMVLIMWTMALRFGEAAALRRIDVDLLHRKLFVRKGVYDVTKRAEFNIARSRQLREPKSGHERTVPWIPERALHALREQLLLPGGPEDPMFPSPHGVMWHHNSWLERVFQPAVRKSATGPLSPHDLRHSAASRLTEQGLPIDLLQQVLGHASRRTTELYIHVTEDDVREGLRKAFGEQKGAA